ncbi:MAG TPA: roadblock/LC7 domain-containing protein [Blastocatellia bacterium]|nr:roadblock/LC7 domain-containing protein [Blastocatellia bacterium]
MNLFSIFRFFRNQTDEPEREVRRSNESQERPRGFFLDKEWPDRGGNRPDQPPDRSRRVPPRADNPKMFSFSRQPAEEPAEEEQRPAEFRERSANNYAGGYDRPARPANQTERNPAPTRRFVQTSDWQRSARGTDAARSFNNGNTKMLLEDLKNLDPGILVVFITSNDGRLAEHTVTTFAEKVRIGASSAISLAVARKESKDLQLGDAKELQIRSDSGSILLLNLGSRGVLTVVINQEADTDRILYESYQVADRLMSIR